MFAKELEEYFGVAGRLSRRMDSFEYRPQQAEMAGAVARALDQGHCLMAEAGTGTGKSLAYLIPAALWAVKNNKKVVISTYSKTLQQQILQSDIPFLREKLGLPFRHSLCVGHGNYLSLRRLRRAHQAGLFTGSEETRQFLAIADWAGATPTGLRDDLPFEVLPSVWEDVGRQTELCLGKRCETHDVCFYFKERRKWFGAHLLIVNHHLFFANVASGGGVLPRYDAVVFDEAQNVEEVATNFLGLEISNTGLIYYLDRLFNPKTQKGVVTRLDLGHRPLHLQQTIARTREAVQWFFAKVFEEYGKTARSLRFHKPMPIANTISPSLLELEAALRALEGGMAGEEDRLEIAAAAQRCAEFNTSLQALLNQSVEGYVYWLEVAMARRMPRAVLRGVPVDVSGELKKQVFEKTPRIVLTSATLTTNRSFDYIKKRIGCDPREELSLDSPFDYRTQALLYIPADMPEPSEKTDVYIDALAERSEKLIAAAGGKTFILFTSYETMNRVYRKLEPLAGSYQLLRQGDLPTKSMIERFKKKPSVIFGTSSFWQGVDIPGEALQSVIITKLPFDVPNEPLTEARLERLRQQALNPFRHYQIPRAIIQLKQGFGRLIRKRTDTGIVSILDSRMSRRGYGKQFVASLPDCRVAEDLAEVEKFLGEKNGGKEPLIPRQAAPVARGEINPKKSL